jgi:hypothetical protein
MKAENQLGSSRLCKADIVKQKDPQRSTLIPLNADKVVQLSWQPLSIIIMDRA